MSALQDHLRRLLHAPDLKDLMWYYEVGKAVEGIFPKEAGPEYGKSRIEQIARAVERSQSHFNRSSLMNLFLYARIFVMKYADPEAQQFADRKKANGYRLTWTHIKYLLSADDDHRKSLQAACWREAWSTGKLMAELKRRRGGRQSAGGRRPPLPTSSEAALVQIHDMGERWVRWYQGLLADPDKSESEERITLKDIPRTVRDRLTATMGSMEELQEATKAALQKTAGLEASD
jgi:hypothetical protein